jgi:hypothetical protein
MVSSKMLNLTSHRLSIPGISPAHASESSEYQSRIRTINLMGILSLRCRSARLPLPRQPPKLLSLMSPLGGHRAGVRSYTNNYRVCRTRRIRCGNLCPGLNTGDTTDTYYTKTRERARASCCGYGCCVWCNVQVLSRPRPPSGTIRHMDHLIYPEPGPSPSKELASLPPQIYPLRTVGDSDSPTVRY